jgi:hypothetical protein
MPGQHKAAATHDALEQLASRGRDFTDNDLKTVLISLRELEEDWCRYPESTC